MPSQRAEDDFEIEVSDIPVTDDAESLPTPGSLRLSLGPRLTRQQRAVRGTVTAGFLILAVLLILGSYLPARDVITLSFESLIPTSVPALAPGANLFYIQRTLSWSTISLDGHTLAHVPVTSSNTPLELTRGSHEVVWRAEPFEPISCTVSVPAAAKDTCLTDYIAWAPIGIYV